MFFRDSVSLLIMLIFASVFSDYGRSENLPDPSRLILAQVAYIGTDYPAAVREGGVVNEQEYRELKGFIAAALESFMAIRDRIGQEQAEKIEQGLREMQSLVLSKGDGDRLADLSGDLARLIGLSFRIPMAPEHNPKLELGHFVYTHHCASCHGERGKGDGPAAEGMEPPARNFLDSEIMRASSPFRFLNITMTGVEGTGMLSFRDRLTTDELWSVSYYLSSLRFHDASQTPTPEKQHAGWTDLKGIGLSDLIDAGLDKSILASYGDQELLEWLQERYPQISPETSQQVLSLLRRSAPFLDSVPLTQAERKDRELSRDQKLRKNLDYALSGVLKASFAWEEGNIAGAESLLLDAYLNGFEETEKELSLGDRKLVMKAEALFMEARSFARYKQDDRFLQSVNALKQSLEALISNCEKTDKLSSSAQRDFLASLVIVIREGIEAFLVIAALLALLSGTGVPQASRWVHAGWITALLAGGVSFVLFEEVLKLSGAGRESLEAICTGIAAILLFYTGFWLLSQSSHQRWQLRVREKSKEALTSGKLWTLFAISFIAVYREAAETVLFYAALYSGSGHPLAVSFGFLAGCICLLIVCWMMIRFNLRLPLRQFFLVTSVLLVVISVILTGKAVHELIGAGYLKPTPLSWVPLIDMLGLYPNLESTLAQLALLLTGAILAALLTKTGPDRPEKRGV
ncbi:MAG: FTR1 family protein [Deltaproteobacteria bacterium]|nr:FTR1 family protein [Deltaproteobacteria bacterium]